VPVTAAVHCEVAFSAIAEGVQVAVTEEIVDDGEPPPWLLVVPPPPQAISVATSKDISKACGKE
jgi:hypothetical protein